MSMKNRLMAIAVVSCSAFGSSAYASDFKVMPDSACQSSSVTMKAWWLVGLVLLVWAASLPAAHGGSGDSLANPRRFVFDGPVEGAIESLKLHEGGKSSSEVTSWNIFASNLVAANLLPGPQTYTLAVAHIAIHDALNAIDPRYQPYEFAGFAPGASVAAAARDTLVQLVPQATASIDAEYDAALSSVPDGATKDEGVATGQAAAAAILARRSSDNLLAAITKPYTPGPANPGVYQPTPPLNFVILAGWSDLPPFALNSASQFRSRTPSSVKSFKYTIDYKEVKTLGSASSTTRTAEQTETARFWYDVAAKEWNFAAQKGFADLSADEWRAARTLAVLNISLADAVIATFDTKFQFNYWRPITAIRAGNTDGNWATKGDPNWEPFCVTPPSQSTPRRTRPRPPRRRARSPSSSAIGTRSRSPARPARAGRTSGSAPPPTKRASPVSTAASISEPR